MNARKAYTAYNNAVKARKRLPKLEQIIMKDAEWAYWYAKDIIKGRWLEAEPIIAHSGMFAYFYALNIIKSRWSEAEPTIIQDTYWAYLYARDVIHMRWFEAEEIIAKSDWKTVYTKCFFDEPMITKDKVGPLIWKRMNLPGYFAPARLFQDKVSLLDMVTE